MSLVNRLIVGGIVSVLGCSAGGAKSDQPGVRPGAVLLQPGPATTCPPRAAPAGSADPSTTASVSGERFVAAQHFRETASAQPSVAISWLGDTFKQRFVDKTEPAAASSVLHPFRLRRPARAGEIAAGLGDRGETALGELWCLLTRQPNGEGGALLTNAVPNLFFIRDRDGQLWTIDVLWGGAGWEIGASAIDRDRPWDAGAQAFSR
jgi:hypothetical protein